jgi:flagellar hook-length control protein FliK
VPKAAADGQVSDDRFAQSLRDAQKAPQAPPREGQNQSSAAPPPAGERGDEAGRPPDESPDQPHSSGQDAESEASDAAPVAIGAEQQWWQRVAPAEADGGDEPQPQSQSRSPSATVPIRGTQGQGAMSGTVTDDAIDTPAKAAPQSAPSAPGSDAVASEGSADGGDDADGEPDPSARRNYSPAATHRTPSSSAEDPLPRSTDAAERPLAVERGSSGTSIPALARAESVQADIDATTKNPVAQGAESSVESRAGGARGPEAQPPIDRPLQPAGPTPPQRSEPTPMSARAEVDPPTPLLARGLAALAAQKGGTMQIRLDPPSLGTVRIELTVRQGAVVAEITASSASTQALLACELGALRGALERQGLLVERLAVHAPPTRAAESQALPTPSASDAGRGESNAQRGSDGTQQRSGDGRHDAGDSASRGRREHDAGGESGHRRRTPRASFARIWSEVEV